jgi:hypothetical protein
MPKAKSSLTHQTGTSVRMTNEQRIMFRRLGGGLWMRELLDREIRKFNKENRS